MNKPDQYRARLNDDLRFNAETLDFLRRRVEPFLDRTGIQTRTPLALLQEAYLQGVRDATDILSEGIRD